jgi:hypothetical protein
MILVRNGACKQLRQSGGARLVDRSAQGDFYRFQIDATRLPPFGENTHHQRGYFARDLGLDRLRRFFSSGVSVSSTGRNAQIFSLTSTI